jgi:cytoskeletal protein CcmA (bactofilin family)
MFQKPTNEYPNTNELNKHNNPDEVETVVGPSVVVEGDFASEGNIIVKGTVSGSVKTSKLLAVEKGASIFANVKAGGALVAGSIKGNVKVVDKLELTETAQVLGDIECKILNVAPGALIQGKVSMKGIQLADEKKEKVSMLGRVKTRNEEEVILN